MLKYIFGHLEKIGLISHSDWLKYTVLTKISPFLDDLEKDVSLSYDLK
jgi:hypothetical protein